jgi:uncharacterized membrane protein
MQKKHSQPVSSKLASRLSKDWSYLAPALLSLVCILILLWLPTGFEGHLLYQGSDNTTAEILTVDNSHLYRAGVITTGDQNAEVKILGGRFKGQEATAFNRLTGSLSQDKLFEPGDIARVVIDHKDGQINSVNLIDHERIPQEVGLLLIFSVLLIVVARRTGFRSLLSFLLTVLATWKILVPGLLRGDNPLILGLVVITAVTVLIMLPIFGWSYRSWSAILGSVLGTIVTALGGFAATSLFHLHGSVMQRSEGLIYAGYAHLDLTAIFMTTIFIGASGAIMDLAVDITSSVTEVIAKKPSIEWQEAFRSGMNVGRAAMGTMTTTLLLAYSGGYMSLLMVFMAQGTPLLNILNYQYVAAEILHTLVGSIGLVLVAPVTALVSATLLCKHGKPEILKQEFLQLRAAGQLPQDQEYEYENFRRWLEAEAEAKAKAHAEEA